MRPSFICKTPASHRQSPGEDFGNRRYRNYHTSHAPRLDKLDPLLARLDSLLAGMPLSPSSKAVVERWRSDAAALRFHLRPRAKDQPLLAAVIGGTGTGKSTIVNRLLGVSASATSFRRTFTGGAVAVAREAGDVPAGPVEGRGRESFPA